MVMSEIKDSASLVELDSHNGRVDPQEMLTLQRMMLKPFILWPLTIRCFNRSAKSFSPLISIQECDSDLSHCYPLESLW